jgi:uncharacterized membrane protein YphA (DoxX/SURF4 family)
MKNKGKYSNSELILRIVLFLIFICSAIFKLIVGVENFEMNLMESNLTYSWIQTTYLVNLSIIAELSCAIIALFGRVNLFQFCFFCVTFLLYTVSLFFGLSSELYQDYTLIFFGFDIYSGEDLYFFGGYLLNILLLISGITIAIILRKKANYHLIKWPFQIVLITLLTTSFINLGSLNFKQFQLKSEEYKSGITDWTAFNNTIDEQFPDLKHGNWTIAFFSVGCDHCKKFARKISFTPNGDNNVLYVFWAKEDEIDKFKKDNNVKGPHLKLPQNVIMNIAGQEFPVFFSFSKGVPTNSYTGNEFTYATLDKIFGN